MRVRTMRDVGSVIRAARLAQGLSQEALAARAGVTRRWISAIEGGKSSADLALVLGTLDVLRIELHSGSPDPTGSHPLDVIDLDAHLAAYAQAAP